MKITRKQSEFIIIVSIGCLIGLITFVVLFSSSSNTRDNRDSSKKQEMIAIVLEWGRLAPFPSNATNISIETEGTSFTRSFRASFTASKQDIQAWIKKSPGINESVPEELSNNKVKYDITPGGGANKAEVTIDYILNKVDIYVSWG